MKQIKLLIIILSILATGLLIVLIILSNTINKKNENIIISDTSDTVDQINEINNVSNNYDSSNAPTLTYNTTLIQVTDYSTLYAMSKCINKYFNYIKDNNIQAVNELGGNNVFTIQNNVNYTLKQAYSTENKYIRKYYTHGILTLANGNFTATEQDVYMVIYFTSENSGYILQTISEAEYKSMHQLNQDDTVNIVEGTYNKYEYEYVNNIKQMEIYLENFAFQVFNNTEKSYKLLNEEYRNKRFGNVNKYVEFLNEKINQIQDIKITQYNVYEEDENKIYVGTDENGNYYYIKEKAYMDYELILDNYTMDDYSEEDEEEKIKKSAEKFILMVNSADYTNAYNLLDEAFKITNFPTEQDFINYIKSNWFSRNIIASKELTEDGICIVKMRESISTTSNSMEKQFKVTLGEGMNFTIKFNV